MTAVGIPNRSTSGLRRCAWLPRDLKEGHILLSKLRKVPIDEKRHQYSLRGALHEDGRVSEEEVRVLDLKIALGERPGLGVFAKGVAQIDNLRAGLDARVVELLPASHIADA